MKSQSYKAILPIFGSSDKKVLQQREGHTVKRDNKFPRSHFLQGVIHPRWLFGISSIKRSSNMDDRWRCSANYRCMSYWKRRFSGV